MNRFLLVIILLAIGHDFVFSQSVPDSELTKRLVKVESEQRSSQADTHHKIQQIESKLRKVEKDYRETGAGLFVSGIFCALWAQYTRRSAWLWFFFGLILAPLALIVLVCKNANDLSEGRMRYWTRDTPIP